MQPILRWRSQRLNILLRNQQGDHTLSFPNPVGLAAGWDKNCRAVGALRHLGFGYIVGGTVTPNPRRGNPRPRVVRDRPNDAVIFSLSFPNEGITRIAQRLIQVRQGGNSSDVPILVSIAAEDIEGFVSCLLSLQPLVDGIEINISSPNTEGLRIFHDPKKFGELLAKLKSHSTKPLFVKLPRYKTQKEKDNVFHLVRLCRQYELTGLTISNSRPVQDSRLAAGNGGLSGRPLLNDTLRAVREIRKEVGEELVINASGGVFTGRDALDALEAGADTVQVMTALWYEGPAVSREINRWLDDYLLQNGVTSIQYVRDV